METKIYRFRNKEQNYLSGHFYFAANDIRTALKMARAFQDECNKKSPQPAYRVNLDPNPKIFPIVEGYLPLNRSFK